MQSYSYHDSGIEWLGKIPTHWKVTKIKNQAKVIPSNVDKKSEDNETPVRLCNYVDVYYNDYIRPNLELMEATANENELKKFQLQLDDVLITKDSEDPLDIAVPALVLETEDKLLCGYHLSMIRKDNDGFSGAYLFWVLKDKAIASQLYREATGVTRWAISSRHIKNSTFPLPSLAEQRAIAGFLDEACGKIDAAIQVKREQVAMLDVMAKAILNKAVLEGLNPTVPKQTINNIWFKTLPAHWQLRRLKDVSTMQTGVTLGKDYDGETDERPYLRVANVQDGHLALDDVKTIKLPPHLVRRYELQDGDVLMNEGGDLDKLGRGHVWHNEIPGCLHQNHVFALRCFPHKLLPDYLTLLTSSTHGRAYFEIMGKKTTNLASINSTKVNLFPVPLPPVIEQAEIVQWVQHERTKLKQAQDAVSAQISVLEAYKKSLVHECVTGKKQVWNGDGNELEESANANRA